MKRCLWIMASVLIIVALQGCGKRAANNIPAENAPQATPAEATPGNVPVQAVPQDEAGGTEAAMPAEEIVVGQGYGPVTFRMSKEEVVNLLGEPEVTEANGIVLIYSSRGFTVAVSPRSGVNILTFSTKKAVPPNLKFKDFAGKTKEGIGIGSSESEIVAAYGQPNTRKDSGRQVDLDYEDILLHFTLLDDRVVQFTMRAPIIPPRRNIE